MPPVDRFDGPQVRARREASFDDRTRDAPRRPPIRSRPVGHRVSRSSSRHRLLSPSTGIRVRNRNGLDGLLCRGPRPDDVLMPVVTMSETIAALRATVGKRGMSEDDLRALADYLMSFFGFETEAIDNNLDVADRDVFYMLEEEGLLTTRQEEVMIKKGKLWRIHHLNLRRERIKAFAHPLRPKPEVNAFAVYNELPDDIWARQMSAR